MDSVPAQHIVLRARIREIIHLDIVLYAFPYETEAVLPQNHIVHGTLAYQELALQIIRLVYQAGQGIAFRVYMTSYHFQSMTGPPATATLKMSG